MCKNATANSIASACCPLSWLKLTESTKLLQTEVCIEYTPHDRDGGGGGGSANRSQRKQAALNQNQRVFTLNECHMESSDNSTQLR